MALRMERRLELQRDYSKVCAKDDLTVACSVARNIVGCKEGNDIG
jgi:hypothetical protein